MGPSMAGKLVPTSIHLLNNRIPCRRGVDGALPVINTGDEKCCLGIIRV